MLDERLLAISVETVVVVFVHSFCMWCLLCLLSFLSSLLSPLSSSPSFECSVRVV